MANDKAVSVRTRFEVFKRDRFACQYCGATPPTVVLEVDHIVPRASDGDNSMGNLITACWGCNRGKSDKSLTSIPQALSEQIEERQERSQQVAAFNSFLLEEREQLTRIVDQIGRHYINQYVRAKQRDTLVFGDQRATSIKTFLKHLAPVEILDAVDIAMAKWPPFRNKEDPKTWKYFCGVCWTMIRNRQVG